MEKTARIKLKDRTLENDIKYSGILSYRYLRIIAWICLALSQLTVILSLEAKLNSSAASLISAWNSVLNIIGELTLPLFLLANFSNILSKKDNYKSLFIFYGGAVIGMYALTTFISLHYGYGLISSIMVGSSIKETANMFNSFLPLLGKTGYTLNIFIDLLLCSLLFFFVNYYPKSKIFSGKKIIIFRLFIMLPILYEVGATILKYYMYSGTIVLSSFVFFLLPSKSIFIFLAFLLIVFFLKIGELKYLKVQGHTKTSYKEYTKTNAHSLRISIMISLIFIAVAILDIIVSYFIIYNHFLASYELVKEKSTQALELTLNNSVRLWQNVGLLGSLSLILVVPIVMLFSYTKKHKNKKIDRYIPIAGIILVAFVYVEGLFLVLTNNLSRLIEVLVSNIDNISSNDIEEETADKLTYLYQSIKLFFTHNIM